MKPLQSDFIARMLSRCIAIGILMFFAASIAPPAIAQDKAPRHISGDHGGGGAAHDIGTGLASGFGTSIITNQLSCPSSDYLRQMAV